MFLNNLKIILIIYLILISKNFINPIEKPKIKTGISSYEYYKKQKDQETLYPSSISDKLFFSIEEKLTDYFKFGYKIDFSTYDYNKYSSNLENLKAITFNNTLNLLFMSQKNEIKLTTKPMLYYKYGEIQFKQMNKIQYKLDLKNFSFKTYYSHQYNFKKDELFYHNIACAFYWNLPKHNFIKFKSEISVYLQHYTENYEEKMKEISIIKSTKFNFEIAIDFNKINFYELFDKKNNDDEFFEEED